MLPDVALEADDCYPLLDLQLSRLAVLGACGAGSPRAAAVATAVRAYALACVRVASGM